MKKSNIVLVGFMGAGKTVTAKMLAQQLGFDSASTDEYIVEQEGRSINAIFESDGEAYFRDIETQAVRDLSGKTRLVIDCGGGVVLRQENMDALKENGTVIYLRTSPDVIYERVKNQTHRPLLNVPDPLQRIKDILKQRARYYAQADCEVLTDGKTAQEVAQGIVNIVSGNM